MMAAPANARAVVDVAAALVAQLQYRHLLHVDRVLLAASEFFHQSIIEHGYLFEPIPEELQAAVSNARVVILVAGAQTRPTFQSRVDACVRILKELLPPEPTITFSGGNPAWARGAQQLDEAGEMMGYFRLRRRTDSTFPASLLIKVVRESEANNTIANVRNFFHVNPVSAGDHTHLIVVSSLFHLPRFIDEVHKFVSETHLELARLTFVSAEEGVTEIEEFMREANYLKSCMFELFSAFVRHQELTELLRPPRLA